MLVPVVSPRIGRALGDNIKCLGHRMITEDATVHLHPIRSRSTRLADVGGGQDSVTPIQPAVWSPAQTVDDVVPYAVAVEAVEHNLRFAVRYVVAIAIRDEQMLGAAATHTPPKPTSMPAMCEPLSQNTFRLSSTPSLFVSSKIRMRSFIRVSNRS